MIRTADRLDSTITLKYRIAVLTLWFVIHVCYSCIGFCLAENEQLLDKTIVSVYESLIEVENQYH